MSDAWDDAAPQTQAHEHLAGGHYLVTRYQANAAGMEALRVEAVGPTADKAALLGALAGWTMLWLMVLPGRRVERGLFHRASATADDY